MSAEQSTTTEPLAVLIADDHAGYRSGMRALLTASGIAVVGDATSGEEAVDAAARLQPDVVLMDLDMPGVGGIEATRSIVGTSPHIAILIVSMHEDEERLFAALRAGARGYLLKGADRAELLRGIRSVASGEAIFGPPMARRLATFFASRRHFEPQVFPELTDREREVLDLIARGLSNSQIADRLVLSPKTIRNNISNIFSKLQVADRAQAIVRAREAGLGGEGGAR